MLNSINYRQKFRELRELCIDAIIQIVLEKGEKNNEGQFVLAINDEEKPKAASWDDHAGIACAVEGSIVSLETVKDVDNDLRVYIDIDEDVWAVTTLRQLTMDELADLHASIIEL